MRKKISIRNQSLPTPEYTPTPKNQRAQTLVPKLLPRYHSLDITDYRPYFKRQRLRILQMLKNNSPHLPK